MLDTRRRVETPEGVELELAVAGPASRAQAWLVDGGIRYVAFMAAALLAAPFGEAGMGLLFLVAFALSWGYPVAFEVLNHGATPGKAALGIEVVHDDGTPVRFAASAIRNLVAAVDFLPFAYGFGLAAMAARPDFKRLGDLAAGTVVVYRERRLVLSIPEDAVPVPPPVPLTLAERRAIMDFAERVPVLSSERAQELAALVEPLAGRGPGAVRRLVGMAAWLAGRR